MVRRLAMVEVGDVLGSYELTDRLGEGGGGSVFKARHVLLGREVAIKVMNPELVGEREFVSRFFHEARIVNAIRHPNIIDIVDFLDLHEPRRVAYVMELLHGRSLGQVAEEGPVTAAQAANACLQIASVLKAVHEKRIIHRDLKPDNVFVIASRDSDWSAIPSVKVLDFGMAKSEGGDVGHRTQTGMTVGTPLYMAPEQYVAAPVSPATDVYALGEILYEILSGERLFQGSNRDALKQKISGKPAGRFAFPGLADPGPVTELIRRCISLTPEDRPSLDEVSEGLRHLASARTVALPPPRKASAPRVLSEPTDPFPGTPDMNDFDPYGATLLGAPAITRPEGPRIAPASTNVPILDPVWQSELKPAAPDPAARPPSNVAQAGARPPSNAAQAAPRPPSNAAQPAARPPSNAAQAAPRLPSNAAQPAARPPSNVAQAAPRPPSNVAPAAPEPSSPYPVPAPAPRPAGIPGPLVVFMVAVVATLGFIAAFRILK